MDFSNRAASEGHHMLIEATLKGFFFSTLESRQCILSSEGYMGESPMGLAVEKGHLKVCEALIRNGFLVDMRSPSDGATPLYIAAQNGNMEVFYCPFFISFFRGITPFFSVGKVFVEPRGQHQ